VPKSPCGWLLAWQHHNQTKKKHWGKYVEPFHDAKKWKNEKEKKLPSWPVQKLSSDDMVMYAHILHTLWECSKKIIGPSQGPFLGCEVWAKHHANMSLNYNEYYAPLEWS
jgi:hypothetical protein